MKAAELTIMNVVMAGPPAAMYGVTSSDLKSASVPLMAALKVTCPTISGGGAVVFHCAGPSSQKSGTTNSRNNYIARVYKWPGVGSLKSGLAYSAVHMTDGE